MSESNNEEEKHKEPEKLENIYQDIKHLSELEYSPEINLNLVSSIQGSEIMQIDTSSTSEQINNDEKDLGQEQLQHFV